MNKKQFKTLHTDYIIVRLYLPSWQKKKKKKYVYHVMINRQINFTCCEAEIDSGLVSHQLLNSAKLMYVCSVASVLVADRVKDDLRRFVLVAMTTRTRTHAVWLTSL